MATPTAKKTFSVLSLFSVAAILLFVVIRMIQALVKRTPQPQAQPLPSAVETTSRHVGIEVKQGEQDQ
jgi:hypothetical protein